ncbi:helix-hairpin-helix domain-containing protein [Flavobacterium sp. ASW18X]|uniref:helix-hairpin-helix domain-containing protein n=1 Tax=Flavobacterium sp. ASW18X TaxID=2572595 RepID=UPI0010ADD273|nr:helix-hairpin-helix domain-containing protein [Flavobacterium sp. ASW18X]TKD59083.1 helix-hairpin-helix domain-containing protein [Flavobacterium sp. ASW18X]
MKNSKSHFRFSKQERSGIFYLLLLLILILGAKWLWINYGTQSQPSSLIINQELQKELDSLRALAKQKDTLKLYPFNPNYISDYKAYFLGLSSGELENIIRFRAKDSFMNSPEDFQNVSGISDSMLKRSLPFLRFPKWKTKKRGQASKKELTPTWSNVKTVIDINLATKEDLMQVKGIGEKLAARTIKFRDKLGGFVTEEQFMDVYGLPPEVAQKAMQIFKVLKKPSITPVNINTAPYEELVQLIYIDKKTAWAIVQYRDRNGVFKSYQELKNLHGFPSDKLDRIALYLSL